ncbi:MAG TPA: hypothetical protein VL025_21970, partial [Thermoanaerobaculia bacterium]|nr:hypothetical protein [Thermoanaerobaculia bacterium]
LVLILSCARQEIPALPEDRTAAASAPVDRKTDEEAVRKALHAYLDQNGAPSKAEVELAQISIVDDYALVTWTHGEDGGQALLHREGGLFWKPMNCGPGWMGLRGICAEDVPVEVAKKLLDGIDPNWVSYEKF